MLLSLALWPPRPLRPAQLALGAAFGSIAAYVRRFAAVGELHLAPGRTVLGAGDPRGKLAAAHETLDLVEGINSGSRPAARALDALHAEGEALLAGCEALGAQVVRLRPETEAALAGRLSEAVGALGRLCGRCAGHERRRADRFVRRRARAPGSRHPERGDGAGRTLRLEVAVDRVGDDLPARVARRPSAAAWPAARSASASAATPSTTPSGARSAAARAWWRSAPRASAGSALLRHALRFGTALAAGLAVAAHSASSGY
jgi:hypothetical protein